YEGQEDNGLKCIENIRERYDGCRRSPFNEAECGHHYARAMASWAAVLAMTGFGYSGVEKSMTFAAQDGEFFFSNGYVWGTCSIKKNRKDIQVELSVLHGQLHLSKFILRKFGHIQFDEILLIKSGEKAKFNVSG
ncbi:MAG: hypothetical protein HQ580_03575, partial [Planctomycetes bacterium]|nr:hypothetical protein [Planctomycetota bacterium]